MAFGLFSRIKKAWNVFLDDDQVKMQQQSSNFYNGFVSSDKPDRIYMHYGNERSIINSIYNRIAIDVSLIDIRHVKMGENSRFSDYMNSTLDQCLSIEANIDQTGRMFIHDLVLSLMDEGVVAVVPVDVDINPRETDSYKILSLRVGEILEWKPSQVKVRLYNERTGKKEEIYVPKSTTAIIENPFYTTMNSPNSTMRRLIRKLNLLDTIDEYNSSGKFNLIIQNPYGAKTQLQQERMEQKMIALEDQLSKSKYGIGRIDGVEKIIQLNRPLENGLLEQIDYLTKLLFSELGITQEILNGTADAKTMNNYQHRILIPILKNICEEFKRKFLTKTAITQHQTITYFINPFDLLDINNIAELADKFTRNEILTSNEIRQILGIKPSEDPKADMLINSNLSHTPEELQIMEGGNNDTNNINNILNKPVRQYYNSS